MFERTNSGDNSHFLPDQLRGRMDLFPSFDFPFLLLTATLLTDCEMRCSHPVDRFRHFFFPFPSVSTCHPFAGSNVTSQPSISIKIIRKITSYSNHMFIMIDCLPFLSFN